MPSGQEQPDGSSAAACGEGGPATRGRRAVLSAGARLGLALIATPAVGGVLAACGGGTGRASSVGVFGTARAPSNSETDDLLRRWDPDRPQNRDRRVETRRRATRPDPFDDVPAGVMPRSAWAGDEPIPSRMDPMLPVSRITFHHDGMDSFRGTSTGEVKHRLEAIRLAHTRRNPPFGDIGYHYIVDPAGRVWQGRPLTWQGAHVGRQNEHNLGICILGNYEQQQPNAAQLLSIERFLAEQMARYRVTPQRVFTHRELAATACPGRFLQPRLASIRASAGRVRVS